MAKLPCPNRSAATSSTPRPGRTLDVVSDIRGNTPVTEAEVQLVLAMLGPRLAAVFADDPDD